MSMTTAWPGAVGGAVRSSMVRSNYALIKINTYSLLGGLGGVLAISCPQKQWAFEVLIRVPRRKADQNE